MFCPKCGYEYREGFYNCSDCGIALVSAEQYEKILKRREAEAEEKDVKYVVVFRTCQIWEIEVLSREFIRAGIPFYHQPDTSSVSRSGLPSMAPGEWRSFYVPEDSFFAARQIIDSLTADGQTESDGMDSNSLEETNSFWQTYVLFSIFIVGLALLYAIIQIASE